MRFPGIPDLPDPRREGWGPFFKAFVLREDGRLRQGWRILGFLLALFLASLLVSAPVGLFFLGRSVPVWFPSLVAGLVCLLVSCFCAQNATFIALISQYINKSIFCDSICKQ